jgi:hypothetical protein
VPLGREQFPLGQAGLLAGDMPGVQRTARLLSKSALPCSSGGESVLLP